MTGPENLPYETPMTATEHARLNELEQWIETLQLANLRVGLKLREIRDNRLYRESHADFDRYCEDRWELSGRHVNRLIDSARVIDVIGPNGPEIKREAHARELAPLLDRPEALIRVWLEVHIRVQERQITAALIKKVRLELFPPDPQPNPNPHPEPEPQPNPELNEDAVEKPLFQIEVTLESLEEMEYTLSDFAAADVPEAKRTHFATRLSTLIDRLNATIGRLTIYRSDLLTEKEST